MHADLCAQLREACSMRGITTAGATYPGAEADLQKRLQEWLDVTTHAPSAQETRSHGQHLSHVAASSDAQLKAGKVFVPERAAIALLGVNVLSSVRAAEDSELQLLMISGPRI